MSRIAVVGGGLAGTLCSLVLKNRGLEPCILEASQTLGGRLRQAPFFRAQDPRLMGAAQMLEHQGLLHHWKGRFGLLGSQQGGFLPADIVARHTGQRTAPVGASETTSDDNKNRVTTDGGDFCQFVNDSSSSSSPTYTNLADLSPQICQLAGIDVRTQTSLKQATPLRQGGWSLKLVESDNDNLNKENHDPINKEEVQIFDGLVLATHDPSLVSRTLQSIGNQELEAAANDNNDTQLLVGRLHEMAQSMEKLYHADNQQPVYVVSWTFPRGFSQAIPFDAVSVPGSSILQYLYRNDSSRESDNVETWTAITTSSWASDHTDDTDYVTQHSLDELRHLWSPYDLSSSSIDPLQVTVQRWDNAFWRSTLGLKEDSIFLAPWRLTVCGDFIRDAAATPLEATALSGVEAGERLASLWVPKQ